MPTSEFAARVRRDVEARLAQLSASPPGGAPPVIVEAVRYALLGGGKRFRPMLVIAAGEACHPAPQPVEIADRLLTAACAIEMIHTFSLIHDDLPALDNDSLRRGRPTLHVKFTEATAILAGDALLNLAWEVLCRGDDHPGLRLRTMRAVTRAVGLEGMIAGQVLDLEAEGSAPDSAALHRIHELKTGALITACCEVGGILSGAGDDTIAALREFGGHVGLAFQIIDDILDVEGSPEELGKSPGKDASAGKATYPGLLGLEESRRRAARSVEQACHAVQGLPAEQLVALARSMLNRKG
jgi:geranylgeranyl diphosphate synthase type II